MLRYLAPVSLAGLLLGGCATFPNGQSAGPRRLTDLPGPRPQAGSVAPADGLTCADASYSATMADGTAARTIAETALRDELANVRGDMLTAGFRKLRYEMQPTRCEATGGFGGEIHCKAVASLCGR